MKCAIYAVKDELNEEFMNPMFVQENGHSEDVARRNFATNVNEIPIWRSNPSDWSLYKLGEFESTTGIFTSCKPDKIVGGRAVLKEEI